MGTNVCHLDSIPSVSTDGEGRRHTGFKSSCLENPWRASQHQAALPFFSASACSFPLHPPIPVSPAGWRQQCLAQRCIAYRNKRVCHHLAARKRQHRDRNRGCPQAQREAQAASCRPCQCKGSCLVSRKLTLRRLPSSETTLCWGKGKRDNWLLKIDITAAAFYLM